MRPTSAHRARGPRGSITPCAWKAAPPLHPPAVRCAGPTLRLRGGVFVDLGSGTCRVVAGASLLRPFSEVRGIEILPALHAKATAVVRQLSESRPAPSGEAAAAGEGCASVPQRIAVSCGDFLEVRFGDL